MRHVFIGWDAREAVAAATLKHNIEQLAREPVTVHFLKHKELRKQGLFWRPWVIDGSGQLRDQDTDAPMSTEFSFTRFLVPEICRRQGLHGSALFLDCDMLTFAPIEEAFAFAEAAPDQAVMCVKHDHVPVGVEKMDGVQQTAYYRKNWSSFMLFNIDHPENRKLNVEAVNTQSGLSLHGFYWTDRIGSLPPTWNWLYGEMKAEVPEDVKCLHFTSVNPWMHSFGPQGLDAQWAIAWHRWKTRMLSNKPEYIL